MAVFGFALIRFPAKTLFITEKSRQNGANAAASREAAFPLPQPAIRQIWTAVFPRPLNSAAR
jgi:type IV secretory pathway TrbL component